jgi:YfiR/HmsC-like
MSASSSPRRTWLALLGLLVALVTIAGRARADARVPMPLQAQLTGRLGTFDRNFQARAGTVAHVLVVHKPGNAESQAAAKSFATAVLELRQVGGLPAAVEIAPLVDGPRLAARCRSEKIALVYLAAGLEQDVPGIAAALAGADVLTVGPTAAFATGGAVVAFDLEEARPKLILNLRSAKAQNVSFKAELIKLARLVE